MGSRDRERIIIEVGRSIGECSQSRGRSKVLHWAGTTDVERKLFPFGIQKE